MPATLNAWVTRTVRTARLSRKSEIGCDELWSKESLQLCARLQGTVRGRDFLLTRETLCRTNAPPFSAVFCIADLNFEARLFENLLSPRLSML